ncbi:unnamed protein product [Rangifer tarandus platyrhynchus]|uniref:Uncharacterized protein n=2 Tax=Rangifer tarandus platyrhynchus TaxID=3082113 RepID=A0ABN8ZH02_RANTA|nr:unnamed protein product [Rangifer tarandus platyrhynchus]CAI9708880.1 unnamed protein product [Rangifer tarandus platyrhynchus]
MCLKPQEVSGAVSLKRCGGIQNWAPRLFLSWPKLAQLGQVGATGAPRHRGCGAARYRAATVRDANWRSYTGSVLPSPGPVSPNVKRCSRLTRSVNPAGAQRRGVRPPTAGTPRIRPAAVGPVRAGSGLGQVVAAAPLARRPAGGRAQSGAWPALARPNCRRLPAQGPGGAARSRQRRPPHPPLRQPHPRRARKPPQVSRARGPPTGGPGAPPSRRPPAPPWGRAVGSRRRPARAGVSGGAGVAGLAAGAAGERAGAARARARGARRLRPAAPSGSGSGSGSGSPWLRRRREEESACSVAAAAAGSRPGFGAARLLPPGGS